MYLNNNAERLECPGYHRQRLPAGSAAVESMRKVLVGCRCKRAGIRHWIRRGAGAVLRLRAAQFDGEFGFLWDATFA